MRTGDSSPAWLPGRDLLRRVNGCGGGGAGFFRLALILQRENRDQGKEPGDAAENQIGVGEANGIVQIACQRRVNSGGDRGDEQHQQIDRRRELVVEVGGDEFKDRYQNQRLLQSMHHFHRTNPHRAEGHG